MRPSTGKSSCAGLFIRPTAAPSLSYHPAQVLTGGQLLVTFAATWESGGLVAMLGTNRAAGHLRWVDSWRFDLTDAWSFWNLLVGGVAAGLVQTISDQIAVQRILSARSAHDASRAYWMKFVLVPTTVWPCMLAGLSLFSFYNRCPDSDKDGALCPERDPMHGPAIRIHSADEIFPFFVVTELPPGLAGLVISEILAATMSTISSGLSSVTTVLVVEFCQPLGCYRSRPAAARGQQRRRRTTRGCCWCVGC